MSKKETNLTTGISEPEKVDEFIKKLKHPMLDTIVYLRKLVLSADKTIGEGIYWNAPAFYFTGKMEPFNPKEYKRFIVGFNFYRQDTIRLIFLRGAAAADPNQLLEGDYKDGRRLLSIKGLEDLKNKEKALRLIIKDIIGLIRKD